MNRTCFQIADADSDASLVSRIFLNSDRKVVGSLHRRVRTDSDEASGVKGYQCCSARGCQAQFADIGICGCVCLLCVLVLGSRSAVKMLGGQVLSSLCAVVVTCDWWDSGSGLGLNLVLLLFDDLCTIGLIDGSSIQSGLVRSSKFLTLSIKICGVLF